MRYKAVYISKSAQETIPITNKVKGGRGVTGFLVRVSMCVAPRLRHRSAGQAPSIVEFVIARACRGEVTKRLPRIDI